MTPEQLTASILQYAIQGKLVEQRAEEGTAEELYQQIQEEKIKLINEGKIKKEKPLDDINDDEIPFEIPDGWKWVRLGDCSGYSQTKEKISAKDIKPEMWSLDLEDIQKDSGKILVKTMASERKITGDKVKFHKGQVLYSKLRPYLKKILVAPDDGIATPELVPFSTYCVNEEYLVYVLKSPHVDTVINAVTYGVKMPRVGTDTMVNLLIPLPPFKEQCRIVTRIEELLPLVDRYAEAYEKLENFNAKFPEDMKKSILQYAIQGKLVEQRAEEGTAEELWEQIKEERKNYKIKEFEVDTIDEMPFDIPDTWRWVRLQDIVKKTIKRGKSPKYADRSDFQVFAQKCNVKTGGINMNLALFLDDAVVEKYPTEEFMCNGDIVINSTGGGTMGRVGIFHDTDRINNMRIVPDGHVTVIRACDSIDYKYLYYFIKHNQKYLETQGEGSTNQTELKPITIASLLLPLPPLEEQHRIVKLIEELLPYCDKLISKE